MPREHIRMMNQPLSSQREKPCEIPYKLQMALLSTGHTLLSRMYIKVKTRVFAFSGDVFCLQVVKKVTRGAVSDQDVACYCGIVRIVICVSFVECCSPSVKENSEDISTWLIILRYVLLWIIYFLKKVLFWPCWHITITWRVVSADLFFKALSSRPCVGNTSGSVM